MENPSRAANEPPRRSILEEIGNAVTHGVGALFAIAGLVLLLLRSSSPLKLLCAVVYGFCLVMMFLMSCLYHSFRWGSKVKRLWRRFDYISIYLLIGGTFTPMWLLFWQGPPGTIFCIAQWAVIIAGITFVAIFGPGRPKALHITLFIVLGWCGLVFLPRDEDSAERCMAAVRAECDRYGIDEIACRDVPVDHSAPGPLAAASEPRIVQLFLTSYDSQETLDRKLYSLRVRSINAVAASDIPGKEDFYICSLSTRTITYKGMLTPAQLRAYYPDLSDPKFESAIAMVHSRFSTNTFPMWKLAQPFRMLCHNGEINTIRANRQWMSARESVLETDLLPDLKELFPLIEPGMSDSASLDNVFEFLTMSGKSVPNALSVLIPESWNNMQTSTVAIGRKAKWRALPSPQRALRSKIPSS